ncbi:DUF748 domain-containing protein [Anaeromyxobacter paludicola]|uniref:DUF748 domain-containing protein n=1 Tax=Anaeromyxobacter paludicola TaxID=2918171 RepID=A0ABN6N891_9BACT|nr:DUF748 domain-containing protein [Anaeromyxobacter paludicola]BDG09431.1 hypothetical protein AMPC_25440 [Anaeromyxobacter paludicola]
MSRPAARTILLRAALALSLLLALYAALGFLLAPRLLRSAILKQGSAALKREVRVGRVEVNPFALSVRIRDLEVRDHGGEPLAGWGSLYVRVTPLRLLHRELGLAEVRLDQPAVSLTLQPDGALNVQDLLAPSGPAAAQAPAKAAPAGQKAQLGLYIGQLAISGARVTFTDRTRTPAFRSALGPLSIALSSFRTAGGGDSPYAFSGATESGETFSWSGTVDSRPLRSSGTISFAHLKLPKYGAYIKDQATVEVLDGSLSYGSRYELAWDAEKRVLALRDGRLEVEQLGLAPLGQKAALVALPRVEVAGIDVDLLGQEARVGAVRVKGGEVRVGRDAAGKLGLSEMGPRPPPPGAKPGAWRWSVGTVEVEGLRVPVEDRSTPVPARFALEQVAVKLGELRPGPETVCPLEASLLWNGKGKVEARGPIHPFGKRAELELAAAGLDLTPLAPFLESQPPLKLTAGTLGLKARTTFDGRGAEPRWSFAGEVRVEGLSLVSPAHREDQIQWRALELAGIDAGSTPPRAVVQSVRLVAPRFRLHVWEDGSLSFASKAAGKPVAKPAATARPAGRAAPAWRTGVGSFQIAGGEVALADRSVRPPALLTLGDIQARITHLSSDPSVRSVVDVRAKAGGAAPVSITGTLNPLQKEAFTDLKVASRGIDLSPFGPYAGKFLGYGIQKGKLHLDLGYKIVRRSLTATNVVKLDQLTLGDKVESPDATKLPVKLALAILTDRDGVIDLDVPVEGNLDDPEFRFGKVIWHTVLNVLVKVATSPFSLLSAIAGGGQEDLSMIAYAPGEDAPDAAAQKRLAALAKSLSQRPALGVEIEGTADPEQDGKVLRLQQFREEHPEVKGEPTPAQLAAVELDPEALPELAAERAHGVRDALVAAGIDQARLFLVEGGERARKEQGARVYFSVR